MRFQDHSLPKTGSGDTSLTKLVRAPRVIVAPDTAMYDSALNRLHASQDHCVIDGRAAFAAYLGLNPAQLMDYGRSRLASAYLITPSFTATRFGKWLLDMAQKAPTSTLIREGDREVLRELEVVILLPFVSDYLLAGLRPGLFPGGKGHAGRVDAIVVEAGSANARFLTKEFNDRWAGFSACLVVCDPEHYLHNRLVGGRPVARRNSSVLVGPVVFYATRVKMDNPDATKFSDHYLIFPKK